MPLSPKTSPRRYRRPLRRNKQKEDSERQKIREALEKQKDEIRKREQVAEEKQRLENSLRDVLEQKERKLQRKEARAAVVSLKEKTIQDLAQQLDHLRINTNASKGDFEMEVSALLQLKETIESQYTNFKSESEASVASLQRERDDLQKRLQQEIGAKERLTEQSRQHSKDHAQLQQKLNSDLTHTTCEVQLLRDRLQKKEKGYKEQTESLERELKLTRTNVKALQDELAAREEDDKKNVMLMNLLKQKFDGAQDQHNRDIEKENLGKQGLITRNGQLENTVSDLEAELGAAHKALQEAKMDWATEINECDTKLEQAKFDAKFLESELQVYKNKLHKQQQQLLALRDDKHKTSEQYQGELEDVIHKLGDKDSELNDELKAHFDHMTTLKAENRALKIQLEKGERENDQLDAMLKKRERDHFDKSTQLASQISQQRNTINQLQQKLTHEKHIRSQEVNNLKSEVDKVEEDLSLTRTGQHKALLEARENEAQMSSDVSTMRSAVFEMQNAIVQKELEIETVKVQMNNTVETFKEQLSTQQHNHERAMSKAKQESNRESVQLRERIRLLTRDLETHHKVAMDTDARRQAEISNLRSIADSQIEDNLKLQRKCEKQEQEYLAEIARLRETLSANFIPHKPSHGKPRARAHNVI